MADDENLDPPWVKLTNWLLRPGTPALLVSLLNFILLLYIIENLNEMAVREETRGYDYIAANLTIAELVIVGGGFVFAVLGFVGLSTLREAGNTMAERLVRDRIDGLVRTELNAQLPPMIKEAVMVEKALEADDFDPDKVASSQEDGANGKK